MSLALIFCDIVFKASILPVFCLVHALSSFLSVLLYTLYFVFLLHVSTIRPTVLYVKFSIFTKTTRQNGALLRELITKLLAILLTRLSHFLF